MAYYLQFDGVDDYVNINVPASLATNWGINFGFAGQEPAGSNRFYTLAGRLSNARFEFELEARLDGSRRIVFRTEAVTNILSLIGAGGFDITAVNDIYLKTDGADLWVEVNGVETDRVTTYNRALDATIDYIGRITSTINAQPFDLYYFDFYENGTARHKYDPSATGGTGSVLEDTVGGNNGTLVNFPVDNSQWVFYDAGVGGVTASSAFTLPKLTLSASGSATLPQPSASGAFSFQPISISSSGSATLPQPEISGAFSVPLLSASGSASATLPQPSVNGSFSYPKLTVSASGSATTTNADINGNITFNQLTVSGNASATLPQPDITGAFSLPPLSVDGSASAIVPQPTINGNIALSKLTISASGEVTLPQPIANGAFNIPIVTVI